MADGVVVRWPDLQFAAVRAYGEGRTASSGPDPCSGLEGAMADPKGFLTTPRRDCARRPVRERVRDRNEVYDRRSLLPIIRAQAGRCMDCGIPFCQHGCPLGNLVQGWNERKR